MPLREENASARDSSVIFGSAALFFARYFPFSISASHNRPAAAMTTVFRPPAGRKAFTRDTMPSVHNLIGHSPRFPP